MKKEILQRLDEERWNDGVPSKDGKVARRLSFDGRFCQIVYSCCTEKNIVNIIQEEVSRSKTDNYKLEWKVYDHDTPQNLREHLLAARFLAEPSESVLVRSVDQSTLSNFNLSNCELRPIHDHKGLEDVATISREIGRTNIDDELRELAKTLEYAPKTMSVYVAYVDANPVACGRIYFRENSNWATLCGGRTKTTHRKQGFYTTILAVRIGEAVVRGCKYVAVEALPTSEQILQRSGFELITHTQPFVYCADS